MSYIEKFIPELHVVPLQATYLLWIDCSKVCQNSVELVQFIRQTTGLYISDGLEYGENGRQYQRVNDGLNRLRVGMNSFIKNQKKQ